MLSSSLATVDTIWASEEMVVLVVVQLLVLVSWKQIVGCETLIESSFGRGLVIVSRVVAAEIY